MAGREDNISSVQINKGRRQKILLLADISANLRPPTVTPIFGVYLFRQRLRTGGGRCFITASLTDQFLNISMFCWCSAISCVCGMVAREGPDLLRLDMCGGDNGENLPNLSMISLTGEQIQTRVLESRGGKILTVQYSQSINQSIKHCLLS